MLRRKTNFPNLNCSCCNYKCVRLIKGRKKEKIFEAKEIRPSIRKGTPSGKTAGMRENEQA